MWRHWSLHKKAPFCTWQIWMWFWGYNPSFCINTILVEYNKWSCSNSHPSSWWRHRMGAFSMLLALCVGNSPVPSEFPTQRPVTRSFDAFFDLCLNERLSKQSWGWWFEMPLDPLWRHCNALCSFTLLFTYIFWRKNITTLHPANPRHPQAD